MKTRSKIKSARNVSLRRGLRNKTVIASLALATATIPLMAADEPGAAAADSQTPSDPSTTMPLKRRSLTSSGAWSQPGGRTRKLVKLMTSQGVQLATMKALVHYWETDYDWRKCEARLEAFPQFITRIDGVDIHFIHVRSKNPNALPLIITHGWPGSIIEQLKIIEPLTNPTGHGGSAADAFDVLIPLIAGPRVLGQADRYGLGSAARGARVDCADETPRVYAICGARRRLG